MSLRRSSMLLGLLPLSILTACAAEAPREHSEQGENAGAAAQALTQGAAPLARLFDGTRSRITIPHSAKFNVGAGDFTLEARVTFDAKGPYQQPIFSQRTGPSDGFLFCLYGQNLLLQMNGVPNYLSSALPELRDGAPHDVALSRAAGVVTFYVDGVARGTVSTSRSIDTTGPLYIGYDAYDRNALSGSVTQARFWNVARPAVAIGATYVPPNVPGLIGDWYPNGSEAQSVLDVGPLANHGYFGSDPARWDVDDPALDIHPTIRLGVPGPANGRLAATGTDGTDTCGEILVNGVFDHFTMTTYHSFHEESYHYFCDNNSTNVSLAVDAAGTLKLPIKGVPVELSASNKTSLNWQKVHDYCGTDGSAMSDEDMKSWLYSVADPTIVSAWLKCEGLYSHPPVLVGDQLVSADGHTIVFDLRANVLVNGQPDAVVVDAFATGATCTGPLTTLGTVIPTGQPMATTCTRAGDGPVTFVVTTTQGAYVFEVAGTGLVGQGWVTASIPKQVETVAEPYKDGSVGSRTCAFGWCSDTPSDVTMPLPAGYTAFRNPSCNRTSSYDNVTIHPTDVWLSDNNTVAHCHFSRSGNHSASVRLVAEAYRDDTTYTAYSTQGQNVDIYNGKNFEVVVGNPYTGKVLHVQLLDHSFDIQDLDVPAYSTPFSLVKKASDDLSTTYLVKLTQ